MNLSLDDWKDLIAYARDQRVQEFNLKSGIGDELHILFTHAAFVVDPPSPPEKVPGAPPPAEPKPAAEVMADAEEAEAAALQADPELFLHADGGPVIAQ